MTTTAKEQYFGSHDADNAFYFITGKLYKVGVTSGPITIDASNIDKPDLWKFERSEYLNHGEIMMFLYERETRYGSKCFFLLDTDIICFKGSAHAYLIEV